ncbi:carbohydrate ABC transporter permease [Jiangella sp. DSM 45060]|uniref:carbohydrate ABC transporter permease n=1 Tax=Jiangella sp. DSM 45060 TaxID=1798224 RepID=UPI00087D0111|nr:sugar ABC transporter permease [Jiangella sp. DSM 45060]SDT70072.1 carbohydrate ABC transporter membrane protein 1, CUT1 family [Jiangella sp. DSM 45060]
MYAAPAAIFVLLLFVLPLLLVGQMSASEWPLLKGGQGLNLPDNYTGIADDRLFWPAVGFTLKYTVIVVVVLLVLSMGMALLVQERRRGVGLLRTAYFLPVSLGLASASLLFWGFYSPQIGPIDPFLQWLGVTDEPIRWIGTPNMALFSSIILVVWKFAGFFMLILMVGLQSIPTEVYEAARVDGAGKVQSFLRITLPLLRPSIALCLIISVTGSLLAFDQFFILTNGGPDNSTTTVVMMIYREAFRRFDLGSAAALSVVVLLVLLVINIAQFRYLRRGADD